MNNIVPSEGKDEGQIPDRDPNVSAVGDTFYINIKIGKRRCAALLDTGSEVTLLPKHLADMSQIHRSTRKLRAANGSEINLVGEWHTTVVMGSLRIPMNFVVSDQVDEVLIGVDWMRDQQCLLSFVDFTLTIKGHRFPLLKKEDGKAGHRIIRKEEVILPKRPEPLTGGEVLHANSVYSNKSTESTVAMQRSTEDNRVAGHLDKSERYSVVESTNKKTNIKFIWSCLLQSPSEGETKPSEELRESFATGAQITTDNVICLVGTPARFQSNKRSPVENSSNDTNNKNVCCCLWKTPAGVSMEPVDDAREPTGDDDQSDKKFQCPECGRRFRRKFDLTRHNIDRHVKIRELCPLCEAVLGSVNSLRRHLLEIHGSRMTTRLQPRRTAAERAALVNQLAEEEARPGIVPLMDIPVQRSFRIRVETERDRRVLVPL